MVSAEQLNREEVVAFLDGQPGAPEDLEPLTGGAWSSAWAYPGGWRRAGGEGSWTAEVVGGHAGPASVVIESSEGEIPDWREAL